MSTAIAKNFQIGADSTATNNFTIFQPATPDGTLRIGNGNTGITTGLVTLNSSGNLGLGVTPSAWRSGALSYDVARSSYADENGTLTIASNAYRSTSNWLYKVSTFATRMDSDSGQFRWYNAPSGTAGNAISFTQAMTLDASGNWVVGGTSASARAHVIQGTAGADSLWVENSAGNNVFRFKAASGFDNYFDFYAGASSGSLIFRGAGTERARIDSSGNLLVGTTSSAYHVLRKDNENDWSAAVLSNATSPQGLLLRYTAASPNGTGNNFWLCYDGGGTTRASLRSNGGLANVSANDVNLSDRREKTNFAPAKSYLETICAIPVQTFNYIDQSEDDPGLTLGVVAQDVQAVAPELVTESNWGTAEEPKMRLSIYQTDLQYALMKAIQEQQAQISDQQAIIDAQQAALEQLTAAIQELNAKVEAQAAEIAALKGAA